MKVPDLFKKFGKENQYDNFDTYEVDTDKTKLIHWTFLPLNIDNIRNIVFSDGVTEEERKKKKEKGSI